MGATWYDFTARDHQSFRPCLIAADAEPTHRVAGPTHRWLGTSRYWAELLDSGGHVHILDGYNCGVLTRAIPFPGRSYALQYLAGLWHCDVTEISVVT